MAFTLRLAWRNIFRNKRRTIISGLAIGIGLAVLIFVDAMMIGMKDNMIASATDTYIGDGQIHGQGFRLTQDIDATVRDPERAAARLETEKGVKAYSRRTSAFGMIASPSEVDSVLLVGVDPPAERRVSRIDKAVVEGSFFEGDNPRDIVLGKDLADVLGVELGDRVVCSASQAGSGDLAQDMFRVSGIYAFGIREMDRGPAFIRLPQAQKMLNLGEGIHEIAIQFKDNRFALREDEPFWSRYSENGNEAVSWTVLMPQMKGILDLFWISLIFMAVLIFGIVAFGIINTLFMSLYERLFEFGVLRAVGTRAAGIRRLIVAEAGSLAAVSIGLGAVLGFLLTFVLSKTGIDYRGIEFAGTTFTDLLYPVLQVKQFLIYPTVVFFFTLLVGLYPAVVAGRMGVADALRKSL
ncbi:MAG: ABC transporter permease [Candidatus Aminicenantes bacterium]|nr:ABC transporter permease [Candidatus Aminicenantes bacterium]